MAIFQGILFLFFGIGLLLVDYRSLASGWLPCGPNGLRGRVEIYRNKNPAGFWLMFAVYGAGGFWLLTFSLRLLAGAAEPLPLNG